jgi:hypothetical protein
MRPHDQSVFLKAADKFKAWILVRKLNERSQQYVGRAHYQPKPISCKPKTAHLPLPRADKQVDGLVVDPFRWTEAFRTEKLGEALELWTEFRRQHGLGEFKRTASGFVFEGRRSGDLGYAINAEPGSRHEGCLTFEGKYLYGDYDLFDIVFTGQESRPTATPVVTGPRFAKNDQLRVADQRDSRWDEISQFLNLQFGFLLIQHGSQYHYKPGEFEDVLAFGPGARRESWSAAQLQTQYRNWGRL